MTRKVAAVDSRDVLRQKRFESFRVVPVEQVTVQATEFRDRCKREFLTFDNFERTDVAEITSGASDEQQQANVCRRRAMSNDWRRIFLIVVGRQPVVFRADKGFEEPPRRSEERRVGKECRSRVS